VQTTRGIGRGFRHDQLGQTLLHEVGHVLGLAHVKAPRQLMAPGRIRADINGWFQGGDLRGLRRLIHG
jgi:predicted Zn-dependent protease